MSRAVIYKVYPDHPEAYKVNKVAEALRGGALMLYPSDTVYAIGCDPHNKQAVERLRTIKPNEGGQKLLTVLCPSLTAIATYARVDDRAFKLMKALTPGPYTFILMGTKEVPKLVLHPKRKTIGVRVPDHPLVQALLGRLDGLLVSTSAKLPELEEAETREELYAAFENLVDVIVDDGEALGREPSTIIDMTTPDYEIVREGLGMSELAKFIK